MKRILFGAAQVALTLMPLTAHAQTATINGSTTYQTIDGFGAASAFLGTVPTGIINTLYSPSSIGLKYIRTGIIPDLTSCTSYFSDCVSVSSGATISAADLTNVQAAVAQGAVVWGSSWSPPASMKDNGVYGAGGNMIGNSSNYTTLAADLASWVTFMAGHGIPVYAISVQNEPSVSEAYPSCLWTAQQIHDFVPYLRTALNNAGYSSVKIMIAEPGQWESNYAATAMNDATVAADVDILAGHAYNSTNGYPPIFLSYANVTKQHQWETEVSDQYDTYDGSMTSGLFYAKLIHNYLVTAKVSAWHYFDLSDDPACRGDNSGLTDCSGNIAKRAYVMGNWARFTTGMVEIGATATPQSGVYVTAFKNASTGAFAIVAINSNGSSVSQPFTLSGLSTSSVTPYITDPSNNLSAQSPVTVTSSAFTATLTGSSVTTFVGSGGGPGAPTNLAATVVQ